MARNKYPEETVNLILDVSLELFLKKGYEHTTIQDIIDHLGGLSKGAIYHHFKSKEEILDEVLNRFGKTSEKIMLSIWDDSSLNGAQKLKAVFGLSLASPHQKSVMRLGFDAAKNPRLFMMLIQSIFGDLAPNYIQPIVKQGMEDGSIRTEYPKELSEVIMLLTNIWLNPVMLFTGVEDMEGKCRFFAMMMRQLGLDVMDDEMIDEAVGLSRIYDTAKNPVKL